MPPDVAGTQSPPARQTLLVRHARPLVAPGVCYGATDLEADAAATREAAGRIAQLLAPDTPVWSSPLRRCQALSRALCDLRPDLTLHTDHRLAEMDFGSWEGWRWADIPQAEIDAWTARFGSLRFGGRESVSELMARVGAAWQEARSGAGAVAWVTHAGVIRAASLWASGVTDVHDAYAWPAHAPGFGEHLFL